MSKPKKQGTDKPKTRGPVLFLRFDLEREAALRAFIDAQVVRPSRQAVVEAALDLFLEKYGFWPSKK